MSLRAVGIALSVVLAARAESPWVVSNRPSRAPASLDCPLRQLVATYAGALNAVANASDIARSLQLDELCPAAAPLAPPPAHRPPRPRWEAAGTPALCSLSAPPPLVFFVSPGGSDAASGSQAAPFATLARALTAVGPDGGAAACVWLRGGTYRLAATVVSRGNLEISAFPGETPELSGATAFPTPRWAPFATANASAGSCWVSAGAAPRGLSASALFDADGARYVRARWPNSARDDAPFPAAWAPVAPAAWLAAPPEQQCESETTVDSAVCFSNFSSQGGMAPCFESRTGCGSLRFDPQIEPGTLRGVCGGAHTPLCNTVPGGIALPAAPGLPWPFAHPEDILAHYMKQIDARGLGWYSLSWAAVSANLTARTLQFGVGGFQSSQGRVADGPNAPFSLEGALELLDADGEYHYDARTGDVYVCGAAGGGAPAVAGMQLATEQYLLSFEGGDGAPLRGVSVRGLSFSRTRSTILEGHAVPGGGDLAAHPRGALTLRGVEGATVAGCTFTDVGGSAVAVTGHALGVQVVDSGVFGAGAHGVLVLGSSALSNATGPALPRGVRLAGNVLRGTGKENKFAAAVAVAIAPRAVVEGNVLYEMPRTGIYYNDVAASPGQLMRNNVLFGANRETTDTGHVYVYNRLAFLGDNAAGPGVVPDLSNHTENLIFSNYGSTWPLDYDDGTQHVNDFANVLIYGGSKQYLGCCTSHHDNFFVFPDLSDNSFPQCALHSGAELYYSGFGHFYFNNTCLLSSNTPVAYNYESCNVSNSIDPPRATSYSNTFLSPAGAGGLAALQLDCAGTMISLAQWQAASGMEGGSTTGPLPDPAALAARLLAFLPGPQPGGSGSAWGR